VIKINESLILWLMGYEMGKIEARMTEARVENGVKITFG